ncbi:MAG: hypothetical protein ACK56F_09630, partial [bacterium]
ARPRNTSSLLTHTALMSWKDPITALLSASRLSLLQSTYVCTMAIIISATDHRNLFLDGATQYTPSSTNSCLAIHRKSRI